MTRSGSVMRAPHNRVIVLHVTIILGTILIEPLLSPPWALLLLIGIKIGIDLHAPLKEHRRQQPAEDPGTLP